MLSLTTLLKAALLLPLLQAVAAFDIASPSTVVAYWGQNSAGSQGRLRTYCDDSNVDVFLLAFLNNFPATPLGLNFANMCGNTFPSGMLNCDQIAEDITYCQSKGKKVMLSLGGEVGNQKFANDAEATKFAATLWNTFGEGTAVERPFGTAVVDGFDLDIENGQLVGYKALAQALRNTYYPKGTKSYYLSAAPQCPFPDVSLNDALTHAYFDFITVQFYNNYCSLDGDFNWSTWEKYAKNTSPNKNIKVFLGLAASKGAAGSGYVDAAKVKSTLASIGQSSVLGGITLWDISQSAANNDYAKQMKALLVAAAPKPSTTSAAPKPSTTTSAPKPSTTTPAPKPSTTTPAPKPSTTITSSVSSVDPAFSTSYLPNGDGVVYHYNTFYLTVWATVFVTV